MKLEAMTGQTETISLPSVQIPKNERIKRAAKTSGLFFVIALVCVFIPGLHFILVPGFLIASVIYGMKVFNQEYYQDMSQATCPNCHQKLETKSIYYSDKEFNDSYKLLFCSKCNTQIKLMK